MVHGEDVLVGEPAGLRRPDALDEVAAAVEEAKARGAEQVLEHARAEEVEAEPLDVDRQRADRLERVEEDERAALVRELDDRRNVDHRPVAVTDVRDRDEQRVVIDRALEMLDRNRSVGRCLDVDDTRAARFLGVPDLPDRRKFPVGEHHLRPPCET